VGESNVELARRGYDAAVRGDFDVIAGLLAPDVRWHGGDPDAPGACHDRREALEVMRRALGRNPLAELVDVVGQGDKVVVVLSVPGRGGEPGARVANLSTFRDGKVVEMVHYADPEAAMAAAGIP
jgi:ketosteroid isomerase-like protein